MSDDRLDVPVWPVPDPVRLPDDVVVRASAGHIGLGPALDALRAIPPEVLIGIEPDQAIRWVRR